MPPQTRGNQLLASMSDDVQRRVAAVAEEVTLPAGQVLHSNADAPVGTVFFPNRGVISVRSSYPNGAQVEVAAMGREGAFGLFSVVGVPLHPMVAEVTIDTQATTVPIHDFRRLHDELREIQALVTDFLGSLFNGFVRALGCYRFHTHEQWVARWLLSTTAKAGQCTLPVTHDLIARRVGSPRHAVSATLGEMRASGLIRLERRAVSILNRAGLQALACDCWDGAERPGRPLSPIQLADSCDHPGAGQTG